MFIMHLMYLKYIDKNLNIIMEPPDSITHIKPYDVGNKRSLFAVAKKNKVFMNTIVKTIIPS